MLKRARTRYAVCPVIGRYDEKLVPLFLPDDPNPPQPARVRFFRSAKAAKAFLDKNNQERGWSDPVPVIRVADYLGPKCDGIFRERLRLDSVADVMPAQSVKDEIERSLTERLGDYACYLDDDWRFGEIDVDAWKRPGHEYAIKRYRGIGEIVVEAVYDVEKAFEKLHPDAPCAMVAAFWRSWQVQRHVANFCAELAESGTALILAGSGRNAKNQANFARVHVYRQLAAFAQELLDGATGLGDGTSAPVPRIHGPLADDKTRKRRYAVIREYCKSKQIGTIADLGISLGMGVTTIRGIVTGERKRFGEGTKTKLLKALKISPRKW